MLWSVLLRLIVYLLLPPAKELADYDPLEALFFTALQDNFSDYLYHITLIPPASYILSAGVFFTLGIAGALHIRAFLVLIGILNTGAVLLLNHACHKAGAGGKTSFWLLLLFSAILVPFELWREAMHYDHFTVFFTAFFAWSLVGLIKNSNSYKAMIWVSLAGGLLVSQSAVNAAIVPFSILCIAIILYLPARRFKKLLAALCIAWLFPGLILFTISMKNKNNGEEALTSNKAGPAMMMVVQRSYNYDSARLREVIKGYNVPAWYLWTYDHPSVYTNPRTGEPDRQESLLAQAFGVYYYSEESRRLGVPFGFDFHPLMAYLRQNDPGVSFLRFLEADSSDISDKPYRMSGYSPVLTPRWIGIYGTVSKRIYFKTLLDNPAGMLKSFIIQQGIFSVYGPLFPHNVMKKETNILVRSGLRTLPGKIPLEILFTALTLVFALVSFITYTFAILNIPLLLFRKWKQYRPFANEEKKTFLLVSIPLICVAIVFSCVVGGENDRYYMQLTPYLIILASLLPKQFNKLTHAG